jgi:cation transport ATPase
MAVPKKAGDKIIGGTLNLNGNIYMRATRVGSETGIAQVCTHLALSWPSSHSAIDYQAR